MIARRAGLLNLGGAMVKLAMIGCAGLVVTGLAGCPSNPVTGSPELALVSEAKLIAQSSAEYRREIDGLRKGGYLIEGGSDVARMQGVTDRLITQAIALRPNASHWQWEVHLANAPGIYNAWCLPGGKMLVYSGLLSRLKLTDDELAQVMAHEVSHALLSHGREQKSTGVLSQVVDVAAMATGLAPFGGTDLATNLMVALPMSRGEEAEADQLGIELAARAGYDPASATAVWAKALAVGATTTSRSDFWSTHPATVKRIEALAQLRDSMEPIYLAARPAAPAAQVASSVAPVATDDGCSDLPPPVDRAECTGRLRLGMSLVEVTGAIGAPDESLRGGHSLRYADRYLEFGGNDSLVRITDQAAP